MISIEKIRTKIICAIAISSILGILSVAISTFQNNIIILLASKEKLINTTRNNANKQILN
ncbi:hypothetical protein CBEIBR21_13270 [Clostridium beijerinckii]|uniref:Uncharacterized protein n=1 Tax=Clostridium beijerinckii TaxID=1520 RepID=A0A1S9N5H1_CLOBE|nr:hypothetical protein CBEIBR21_13270 [Clostridium beijerinckii]